MNLPNKLTMLRIAMIPVFLVVLYLGFPGSRMVGLIIFVLASITDFVDGYIARSRNLITNFGKFMDPLADKLLVMAAMTFFVQFGQMAAWVLLIVIAREFAVTAMRLVAVEGGRVIAAGMSGKIKTATTMVCICVMLTPLAGVGIGFFTVNTICEWAILITTVWSGTEYFVQNRDILDWRT